MPGPREQRRQEKNDLIAVCRSLYARWKETPSYNNKSFKELVPANSSALDYYKAALSLLSMINEPFLEESLLPALYDHGDFRFAQERGATYLHLVVLCGSSGTVQTLLKAPSTANVMVEDHFGLTPLDYATSFRCNNTNLITSVRTAVFLEIFDSLWNQWSASRNFKVDLICDAPIRASQDPLLFYHGALKLFKYINFKCGKTVAQLYNDEGFTFARKCGATYFHALGMFASQENIEKAMASQRPSFLIHKDCFGLLPLDYAKAVIPNDKKIPWFKERTEQLLKEAAKTEEALQPHQDRINKEREACEDITPDCQAPRI
jgi:hypothetical protein